MPVIPLSLWWRNDDGDERYASTASGVSSVSLEVMGEGKIRQERVKMGNSH
jgi:hypothetical protein